LIFLIVAGSMGGANPTTAGAAEQELISPQVFNRLFTMTRHIDGVSGRDADHRRAENYLVP